jgi:hypothetical protein
MLTWMTSNVRHVTGVPFLRKLYAMRCSLSDHGGLPLAHYTLVQLAFGQFVLHPTRLGNVARTLP